MAVRTFRTGADDIYMSDEDLDLLQKYKNDWAAANEAGNEAGKTAAHDAAELLRSKYGYSGGGDGGQYVKLDKQQQAAAPFSYESAPTYTARYQNQLDALTQELINRAPMDTSGAPTFASEFGDEIRQRTADYINRAPFSYDHTQDPSWQAYKKQYTREGDRAAANTMGEYAAMTGGMPSTAAVAASQQAGDYYRAQMADKIPELYRAAYEMYLGEGERQLQGINLLRSLEADNRDAFSGDWNRWYELTRGAYDDETSRLRSGIDALSGLESAARANYESEYNRWYNQNRQLYEDAQQREATEYERSQNERNNQIALAQAAAEYGDYSGLRELGIEPNAQNLYNLALAAAGRTTPVGSGSSGGGGKGGNDDDYKPKLTAAQVNAALKNGISTDEVRKAYEYYYGEPYGESEEETNTDYGEEAFNAMNENEFSVAVSGALASIRNGKEDYGLNAIDNMWPRLSELQRARINSALVKEFGIKYER